MNTNTQKLQRKIMRRVYYYFAARILKHPITVQLALFALALMVFAQLVHVKMIVDTLLQTPVGRAPSYILGAVMNGEVLTLITIGVMMFVGLSVPLQVWRMRLPKFRQRIVT